MFGRIGWEGERWLRSFYKYSKFEAQNHVSEGGLGFIEVGLRVRSKRGNHLVSNVRCNLEIWDDDRRRSGHGQGVE